MAEQFPKVWGEGIEVDIFDRNRQGAVAVLPAATFCLASADPVGGAVAGALEAGAVHEGFDQVDGMAVLGLPIVCEAAGQAGEEVGGQVGDADPGEDEEPDVVGDPRKALGSRGVVPADELVAGVHPPGGGAEEGAAEGVALAVVDEVGQVLAHGSAQAEIVMANEVVGQDLVARLLWGERFDYQGEQFPQRLPDGFRLGPGQLWLRRSDQVLGRRAAAFGQTDEAALLELDQEARSREVLQPPGGRPPVPGFGKGQGDLVSAPVGMVGDELTDERHIFVADEAALNATYGVHTSLFYNTEIG